MDVAPDELIERIQRRVSATLGKYRLDRVLGVGGMAAVYAGTHRNGNKVAIKLLHEELSVSADLRGRFLREGYVANAVGHRGVVRVLDDDTSADGAPFLVMELLCGASLGAHIEASGSRLPAEEIVPIACKLLDVLEAAHRAGVVHRDIKPDNIFLTDEGELKVLDFGIARLSGVASVTRSGSVMGTPAYMAPEQARGMTKLIDGQTDVWAVGAILFNALSGRYVYVGETPEMTVIFAATEPPPKLLSVAPDVDAELARCVDRALAADKAERWASAREMLDALAALPCAGDISKALAARPAVAAASTGGRTLPLDGRGSTPRVPAATPHKQPTWAREILESQPTVTPSQLPPRPEAAARSASPGSDAKRPEKRTRSPWVLVVGGALGALFIAGGMRALIAAPSAAPPPANAAATDPRPEPSAPPAPPSATTAPIADAPAATPTAASASNAATAPSAKPAPNVHRKAHAPHAEPTSSAAAAAPKATAANCNPPWRLNENGSREYKLECFKK